MSRKIAVTGTLEASSPHGTATIEGTPELLKINFPNKKALATVARYETLKRLRSVGDASAFLGQDVVFSVGGAVWATVENGKIRIKSPLQAALFYFSQWLNR